MSLRRSARFAVSSASNGPAQSLGRKTRRRTGDTKTSKTVKKVKRSHSSDEIALSSEPQFKVPSLPVTPVRKRTAKPSKPPAPTPTSSLMGVIRPPYSTGDIDDATPPPLDRPVEPHATNATLITPGGTAMVAYPNGLLESSPSKTGLPRPTATTGTLLEKANAHLIAVEPKMEPLVKKNHCKIFSAAGLAEEIDPFRSLVSGIMAQQVSGAAAKSIKNKFVALFNEAGARAAVFPTPAQVAKTELATLRLAGLSQRKAEYIQGLAEKFASGELGTTMLMKASDEEVMEKLIAVRGLGKWSVEMFACFGLKRMDVFSTGDLGVQRGMAAFIGKDVSKLKAKGRGKWKYMSEEDMLDLSAKFAPYRSLFMWYMWRVEDVDIAAIEDSSTF